MLCWFGLVFLSFVYKDKVKKTLTEISPEKDLCQHRDSNQSWIDVKCDERHQLETVKFFSLIPGGDSRSRTFRGGN